MKDEEMAEEYTAKNGFGSDCNNLTSYDANKEIEQAFLAGLKAGRPVWHDLRKAPTDLPKFRRNILVTCEYRSKLKKKRETFEWDYNSEMPLYAIAWCEIPTFDKE